MSDKTISGLLNGIARRDYYDEQDISNEFLKEQLFPDTPDEEFNEVLNKYESLLKNMIYSDMDLRQLEAFLTSQMKKKQDFLSESQASSITKFWKANKQKIHSVVVERSSWNNSLKSLKWRIDVNYENNELGNEPKVIFEMNVGSKIPANKLEKITFELNEEKLNDVMAQMEQIESTIEKALQASKS